MSRVQTSNGVEHSSMRIYIFNCSYPDEVSWQEDPQVLIDLMRYKFDRLPDFTYKTIKVIGVKKAMTTQMEVHIDTVEYNSSDRLNANESDSLRLTIQDMLNAIPDFTYEKVDIVADRFLDNPTAGYIESMMRVN